LSGNKTPAAIIAQSMIHHAVTEQPKVQMISAFQTAFSSSVRVQQQRTIKLLFEKKDKSN
jgi:hypothetical protein